MLFNCVKTLDVRNSSVLVLKSLKISEILSIPAQYGGNFCVSPSSTLSVNLSTVHSISANPVKTFFCSTKA